MHFEITDSYIFGYKNFDEKYKRTHIFDLDGTIITTKSGNKFPKNKDDWECLNQIEPSENILYGIISNQGGLTDDHKINDWIEKIQNIIKLFPCISFVFASIKDDRNRKPNIGSITIIKQKFSIKKPIYIGDAAGRENDFSDTDYKFALNNGFKFNTPENYFKGESQEDIKITYPTLNYYTNEEYQNILEEIYNIISENKKIVIMMIGFPASSKSHLRKRIMEQYQSFEYYNNDDLKSHEHHITEKKSYKYDKMINDNTNLNSEKRSEYLSHFPDHYKLGIFFDFPIDVIKHLNYQRSSYTDIKPINKIALATMNKYFTRPKESDFDHLIKIYKIHEILNTIFYFF